MRCRHPNVETNRLQGSSSTHCMSHAGCQAVLFLLGVLAKPTATAGEMLAASV